MKTIDAQSIQLDVEPDVSALVYILYKYKRGGICTDLPPLPCS